MKNGYLLEDDALHEQEQPLVDPLGADLRQLPQREDLPHHPGVLDLGRRRGQDLGRQLSVDRLHEKSESKRQ